MMKFVLTAALAAAIAVPASAQTATTAKAPQVTVKVDASLANTVRVSADSAYVLARKAASNGQVASADLETRGGRLVYEVKLLNTRKRASEVWVDAMTGEIVKAKMFGGAKGRLEHHKQNNTLKNAKRDSTERNP